MNNLQNIFSEVISWFTEGLPLSDWIDALLRYLTDNLSWLTRAISRFVSTGINGLVDIFLYPSPIVMILIISGLAVLICRKDTAAAMRDSGTTRRSFRAKVKIVIKSNGLAIFSFLGLLLIVNLDLWSQTMATLALVLVSTAIAVVIGMPLGIFAALNNSFFQIVKPVLDFMQTMPAFVYLIPAIPFFGLGPVSASFATVIFSIPPAIRLTALGIKQIDKEMIEASDSFGSTTLQKLTKVQIPLALPTIMAGINQTIMLALSMVVIAAMIGAGGLGSEVWRAIQRLRPGEGFVAGLAVVILAIVLDRMTQRISHSK